VGKSKDLKYCSVIHFRDTSEADRLYLEIMSIQVTLSNHKGKAGFLALCLPAIFPTYHFFGLENILTDSHPSENIRQCLTIEMCANNMPNRARHLGERNYQRSHMSPDDEAHTDGENVHMGNYILLDYK
jgi:hypothetical protein